MDLSLLIPARNEMWLKRTIDDILANIRGDTEVITILDGEWAEPGIPVHPKVTVVYHNQSIGQRAAVNEAARISTARYVAKVDAHCAFDEGFDVKMMGVMQNDWTMAPTMRNLHVFNWVCKKCGNKRYQGPTPTSCPECDNTTDFERDVVWIPKTNPQSNSFLFTSEPHFDYFNDYTKRPEGKGMVTESMSLQGSFFMMTREKYLQLGVCDESMGGWGSQGIEVAAKTWLSGGKVMINRNTWYAHLFRTQGGDFGFPYHQSEEKVQEAKTKVKDLFFNNAWPKQVLPLSWLVERFWPVPGWTESELAELEEVAEMFSLPVKEPAVVRENPTVGVVYYTDNRLNENIMRTCQDQLLKCAKSHVISQIVSVSLAPLDFGENVVIPLDRGILTMFKQILVGLNTCKADVVFMAEHDLLYHSSHFDFFPPTEQEYYYNENTWKVNAQNGQALFYYTKQTSGLCAYRNLLIGHYLKRVERVEKDGFDRSMGFEPGCHSFPRGVDNFPAKRRMSEYPNIDIRHDKNLTPSRWRQDQFRNQRSCQGWTMADEVPGWGKTKDRFDEFMGEVAKKE